MSLDRELVEAIKTHFARKASAQLQEIVQTNDLARWAPEAKVAATEVLEDRTAGRAQEPVAPEEELQPLPSPPVPWGLGLIVGFPLVAAINALQPGAPARNEMNCPRCGAVVNPITKEGLHSTEAEPWRLICDQCQGAIEPDL